MSYSSQDPKIISVFEIVAGYFVDCFFNHVWHSARTNVAAGSSLTDEYVRRIQAFVTGTKSDSRCYSEVVQGVHHYFTGTTRYTALSFSEFVDRIVGVCVPPEYFRQFSAADKDELLSSVICDLVANLAASATKPDMLRRIIDNHTATPDVTVRMLQDAGVGALVAKRAALHNKFLHKMGQARDTVSLDVVEDMKNALRRLVREKSEAESRAKVAESKVQKLSEQVRMCRQKESKLIKLVELLRNPAALSNQAYPNQAYSNQAYPNDRIPRQEFIAERVPANLHGNLPANLHGNLPANNRKPLNKHHESDSSSSESESESESESSSGSESSSESEYSRKRDKRDKHNKHSKRDKHSKSSKPTNNGSVNASFFSAAPLENKVVTTTKNIVQAPVNQPYQRVSAPAPPMQAPVPTFASQQAPAFASQQAPASVMQAPAFAMQAPLFASQPASLQAPVETDQFPPPRRSFLENVLSSEYDDE